MIHHTDAARAAAAASTHTAAILKARFYNHATEAGWPHEVADSVSFRHSGGRFMPEYDKDVIHEWEFGSADRPPAPVLHRFVNRMERDADAIFEAHLTQSLGVQ